MAGIYDEPELYVAACAYRDVPGDVAAVLRWWRRHGPNSAGSGGAGPDGAGTEPETLTGTELGALPGTVLELAAGPAEHAREFARSGVAATALDLSPAMCAYAKAQAAAERVSLTVVQADMRHFAIEAAGFDLAITMLNSLCHLLTLDDLVAHIESVARHVTDGGMYVIELAHPADVFTADMRTSSEWTTDTGDGSVTVRWGGPADHIDPVTQVTDEHVVVTFRSKNGTVRTVNDVVPSRFWTLTEMEAAVRLSGGFAVAARYGDFDADLPLDAPGAWRMILVLRRTG
ncbi:MAG TPA: class I SAM-dependent methyltransferase [Streptosporangiaceae bacterium]|nr:class I SAM-dependent methyltransferase [Streptosporangiaceae bacterium]